MDTNDMADLRGIKLPLEAFEDITLKITDPDALLAAATAAVDAMPEDTQQDFRSSLEDGPVGWVSVLYNTNSDQIPGTERLWSGQIVGSSSSPDADLSEFDSRQRFTVTVGIELNMILDDWDAFFAAAAAPHFAAGNEYGEKELVLLRSNPSEMLFDLLNIDALVDGVPGVILDTSGAVSGIDPDLFD